MSCPLWRPDCQAAAAVDGGLDAWRGFNTVVDGVGGVVHAATSLGGLLPLVLIVLIVMAVAKLFGAGKSAAVAVVDGYTGGAVSKARSAKTSVRQTVTKRMNEKGRTMRATRERSRGPQVEAHSGQPAIIRRANDSTGRPASVTICAPDAGVARSLLDRRLGGARWAAAGSKPCPHGKDFTFTRR